MAVIRGGALRNPANFCNVVGLRTSPGRVPFWPNALPWFPISVQGPMARTVKDVALLLSAIAGPDARSPISILETGEVFSRPLERDFRGTKVAWSRKLGDLPVSPEVTMASESRRQVFVIICPVNQVAPFDVQMPYVTEINGQAMNTYFEWMKSCYYISAVGLPAISVPCGFTDEGLPVGIQIVGRLNDDLGVLQLAYAFEKATEAWKNNPVTTE